MISNWPQISIEGRPIGPGRPVAVVAELGVNHNGDPALAHSLLRAAKEAGADAAKLQLFVPEELALPEADLCEYQRDRGARDQRELLRSLALDSEAVKGLVQEAESLDLPLFASVFDEKSLRQALDFGFSVLKFGSGELTCLPLHRRAASAGKPVILSCGMATDQEIEPVVELYRQARVQFMLLHCVTAYPAPEEQLNLRSISYLAERFACPVGFSDHTKRSRAACLAVACGAVLIEKHLTLDRTLPGPDHKASLEPEEFAAFINEVRKAETALGRWGKFVAPAEQEARRKVRKSIVLRRALSAGDRIKLGDLAFLRPATGISPLEVDRVLGRAVKRDLPSGHILTWDDL